MLPGRVGDQISGLFTDDDPVIFIIYMYICIFLCMYDPLGIVINDQDLVSLGGCRDHSGRKTVEIQLPVETYPLAEQI